MVIEIYIDIRGALPGDRVTRNSILAEIRRLFAILISGKAENVREIKTLIDFQRSHRTLKQGERIRAIRYLVFAQIGCAIGASIAGGNGKGPAFVGIATVEQSAKSHFGVLRWLPLQLAINASFI